MTYLSIGYKRPELQKWFVNSTHTRVVFFRQGFTLRIFWSHNKGQSLGNKDFTSLRRVNDINEINEAIRSFSCYGES